jgi:hypothetical protein
MSCETCEQVLHLLARAEALLEQEKRVRHDRVTTLVALLQQYESRLKALESQQ